MIDLAFKPGRGVAAVKAAFLDREAAARAVSRGRRRALTQSGALIRTIARRSIRQRRGPSRPGTPPHSHSGELRRLMFFSFEPASESVIVGPAAFARRTGAPAVLEFGGTVNGDGRLVRVTDGVGRDNRGRFVTKAKWLRLEGRYRVAPRPYMYPAALASRDRLPSHFANQIH